MGNYWLPLIPTWLEKANLEVTLAPGWETNSRSTGGYDDILGFQAHHDAINQLTWDLRNSIPLHASGHQYAPVGALVLERVTGRWGVIAAGATNTSGKGGPMVGSRGSVPLNSGNKYLISIEAQNNGVGETWSNAMLDSYVEGIAAITRGLAEDGAYNAAEDRFEKIVLDPLNSTDIHAHFEYTSRKIDPANGSKQKNRFSGSETRYGMWDMDKFRSAVAAKMTQEKEEWEMIPTAYRAVTAQNIRFREAFLVQFEQVVHNGEAKFPYAAAVTVHIVGASHDGRVDWQAKGVAFVDNDGNGVIDISRGGFPASADVHPHAVPIVIPVAPIDEESGQARIRIDGSPGVDATVATIAVDVHGVYVK